MQYYYIILATVAIAALGIYFFMRNKRHISKSSNQTATLPSDIEQELRELFIPEFKEENGEIPVRIFDDCNRKTYKSEISKATAFSIIEKHETLGEQTDDDGRVCFWLNRYHDASGENVLEPVLRLPTGAITPSELFNNIRQLPLRETIKEIARQDDKGLMGDFLKYLPWLLAFGFLAFMFAFAN